MPIRRLAVENVLTPDQLAGTHELVADPLIPVTDDRPRWYIAGQGGGWLGAFTLPVWRHLMSGKVVGPDGQSTRPDAVLGTSVSALHAALAAQGELRLAVQFWNEMDDRFSLDGIKGFTKVSLKEGIWSMKPLHKKIEEMVCLDRVQLPCHVGITTRNPAKHYSMAASEAADDAQWHSWIAASAAIAVVFKPVMVSLRGQHDLIGFDGGHLMSVPWIPYELRPGDRIDFLLHNPLDANISGAPDLGKNKLLGNIKWALWIHTKVGHWEILRRAKKLAEESIDVRLWAPEDPLGDMLDAKAEAISHRRKKGRQTVKKDPVRIKPRGMKRA